MKRAIAATLVAAACAGQPEPLGASTAPAGFGQAADPGPAAARYLTVVGGDYATTAVSFVDLASVASGDVAAAPLVFAQALHSGSRVSEVALAFSGDVVVAQSALPGRNAMLIDRATGVVTIAAPGTGKVVAQLKTSPGFYGNPQDVLAQPSGELWVSRMGRNPQHVDPLQGGDDIALVRDASIFARIDLHSQATGPQFLAAPQRMASAGGLVWVPLGSFSADFKDQGAARLLAIDPATRAVHAVDLATLANCISPRAAADGKVVIACQGSFAKPAQQLAHSGLAVLAPVAGQSAAWSTQIVSALPDDGPWSRDLAVVGPFAFAVTLGNLTSGRPDQLWRVALASGERVLVGKSLKAFEFSGIWFDDARRVLWLGDRGHPNGDLRRWRIAPDGTAVEGAPVASNPGRLPVVDLGAS